MNGLAGTVTPITTMYVRALYDYDADDRTSLSFRQGDIIQVITQLESGWWDGVIHGVRGWFPSNYCEVVAGLADDPLDGLMAHNGNGTMLEEESESEYGDHELTMLSGSRMADHSSRQLMHNSTHGSNNEEAAFWIPQATPDGRLFYFNTLTGVSTMELPLENPTSAHETGPRDQTNVYIPDQTRPPPELLAGGYAHNEDDDYESASDAEMRNDRSRGSLVSNVPDSRVPIVPPV